jgi:hypothetical protein
MYRGQRPELVEQITRTALAYALVTRYTSFVAVDEKVVNDSGVIRTYEVPVEMPQGVSYEGVFGDGTGAGSGGQGAEIGGGEDSDEEDAMPMSPGAASYSEVLVRHRILQRPGQWRWAAGLGFGLGGVGDARALAAIVDARIGRTLPASLMVQARGGLLLLRGDDADQTLGNLMLELVWLRLALIELAAGGGLTLGDGTHATLGAGLGFNLPFRTLSPQLDLRYQNIIVSGQPNPQSYTLGLQLSF